MLLAALPGSFQYQLVANLMDLSETRRQVRKLRRQLSLPAQQTASNKLTSRLTNHSWFRNSKRIAFYLANDGEIDPESVMTIAAAAGKTCYLPVLHPLKFNRLYFAKYQPGNPLSWNHYGIAEPNLTTSAISPSWSLNLILLPLVGFDRNGNRLGMGGGYYDRTLAFKARHPQYGPKLLGLAHSLQEIDNIRRYSWDIPLDGVVTDNEFIIF